MPLVPETTMADVSILISLRNLLARRTTWLVLKTTFATSIFSRIFEAYSMTRIFYKCSNLPTLPLFFHDFTYRVNTALFHNFIWRVNTALFHIFTYRVNTLYPVWLPERTLSFSQFQLTKSTHSSSFLHLTPSSQLPQNEYFLQPFSSSLYFFGETFSSFENRNFVKPQKETNSRDT